MIMNNSPRPFGPLLGFFIITLALIILLWWRYKSGTSWWGPWEDPKMNELHHAYIDALAEHGRKVKAGELTVENFTEDWLINVVPHRKAYEDYQTLKFMGVKITPVKDHG